MMTMAVGSITAKNNKIIFIIFFFLLKRANSAYRKITYINNEQY